MPSDPRVAQALNALGRSTAEFRASVLGALAQVEALLAAQSADPEARTELALRELGVFAAGRVNPARFGALFNIAVPLDQASKKALEHAALHLRAVSAKGDDVFVTAVTPGRGLGATIDEALAVAGRAFGGIIVAELVRGGRYRPEAHDRLFNAAEFRAWNKAERRFAPPLVVEIEGTDLHAGALFDFADGREKLVLVVRGEMAPCPLVRCVTPGTFVMQTVDGRGLDRMASFAGPALAAFVPDGAAVFMHDPAKGAETWQRMSVEKLPKSPTKPIGGTSAWQMGEDLKMLVDLARTPFAVPGVSGARATPAIGTADAVDRLSGWLLDTSGLPRDA